jgi:hypothetical protein
LVLIGGGAAFMVWFASFRSMAVSLPTKTFPVTHTDAE